MSVGRCVVWAALGNKAYVAPKPLDARLSVPVVSATPGCRQQDFWQLPVQLEQGQKDVFSLDCSPVSFCSRRAAVMA